VTTAPILDTARLRLRGHGIGDFEASLELWSDAAVVRHIGGRPLAADEVWGRLLRYVGHWACLGFGYWAVEEKTSGRFLGEVGFADYKRGLDSRLTRLPEIGWALTAAAHGKGYGSEAVLAALAWGDRHLPARSSWCMIRPANRVSLRLAEKSGYRELERATYKDEPTLLFGRDRPQADPSRGEAR
jgi:RimJ/RimL family protein N-acetyltransferase